MGETDESLYIYMTVAGGGDTMIYCKAWNFRVHVIFAIFAIMKKFATITCSGI